MIGVAINRLRNNIFEVRESYDPGEKRATIGYVKVVCCFVNSLFVEIVSVDYTFKLFILAGLLPSK